MNPPGREIVSFYSLRDRRKKKAAQAALHKETDGDTTPMVESLARMGTLTPD